MARTETTPDARVLVGVDISKHRHEVLIAVPGKQRRRRVTLTNTKADFERMVGVLSGYGLPVRIGFEATGNYHRALTHHLSCAGFELKLVSSVALARTREALHNSWDKNDPKDAQVILHMLQIGAVQVFHDPLLAGVRHPGAFEDPRDRLPRQDRALASDPHPLPAALFSGGGSIPPQLPDGLVPGLPRGLSLAALHRRHEQGWVHRSGMDRRRAARL